MSYHYLELAKWSSPIGEPSPFMESEEKKACIHEAGHAVVARFHGFRVEWVSVDHDFIKSDPSAIEVEIDYSSAVCLTRSSERVTPILAKRKVLTKGEKEIIIGYCMHTLAGPHAERHFDPNSFTGNQSQNDYIQAGQVLATAVPNMAARKKLLTLVKRRLEKFLDREWRHIVNVAYALNRQRTLSGDQVDAIISAEDWSAATE